MYPYTTDVISGRRAQPTRGEMVILGRQPLQTYRDLIAYRAPPAQTEEVVLLGQAAGRGPWLTGKSNAGHVEATQVIAELNSRNIFGQSQAEPVSPEEALKWGVDFALYRVDPKRRTGYDGTKPFAGTIRYTTRQYLSDRQFVDKSRYAIAAARRVVGSPKSTARAPHEASLPGVKGNLPHRYEDVIKRAIGL